jgi:hypothetical protein
MDMYGRPVWRTRMGILYGRCVWDTHLYGYSVWEVRMGYAPVWVFCMEQYRNSVWNCMEQYQISVWMCME